MKKNHVLLFSLISLIIFVSSNLFAQNTRELRAGAAPVSGTLSPGEEIWYSVRAAETSILTVETFGSTDTYLEAYYGVGVERSFITENDDGGEGTNARIELFVTADREYLFKLRGYNNEISGPFRIMAASEPMPSPTELRFGSVHKGTLDPDASHWYSVRARERGTLTVETFGRINTNIGVYDAQYDLLWISYGGGMGNNAIVEIPVEPDQVFIFRLMGYNDVTENYEIAANFDTIPPDRERNIERSSAVVMKLGEAVPVYLHNPGESRWFRYETPRHETPRTGTRFAVQTRGRSVDTMLFLYDSQGNLLFEDDDSGEGVNAFIFERLDDGVYFIEARAFSRTATGRFTLHAETR